MAKKSIIINELSHKELCNLTKTFNMTYGSFVESMITYFKKTGQDPRLAENKSPKDMVQILDKRVVSFFKTQERDILKPLRNEVFSYSKKNEELILQLSKSIQNAFIVSNNKHKEEIQYLINEIQKIRK